jgi:hypothetical protein
VTNQMIRRFQLPGTVAGNKIVQSRDTCRKELITMMKDEGFVPLLDVDPVWEQSWVKDDVFEFVYTWQGVYAGEEKAWLIEGNLGGKMIPSTPKTK